MVRFRLIALALSAVVWGAVLYGFSVMKIKSFDDLIEKVTAVTVEKEKPKPPPPPPPPPPPKNLPPPPPARIPPTVTDTPPTIVETPVAPEPPKAPPVITNPDWVRKPNGKDFERYYPARALDREKEGRVVLDCLVNENGSINCRVSSETPEGWDFGDAALKIARSFQMSPKMVDGSPTSGGRVTVPIVFKLGG
jgi:periplasmic protein TonB